MLIFYAYSLIAVSLRLVYVIWYWVPSVWFTNNMNFVQQAAKLCVGVVHDWITLELATRIHSSKGWSDISIGAKGKLEFGRSLLFVIITLAFVAFSIATIVTA